MTEVIATADVLDDFHPAVAAWFRQEFGEPTAPQRLGWPVIASGQNALIVAPTGSGKTLAAFLAALDLCGEPLSLDTGCAFSTYRRSRRSMKTSGGISKARLRPFWRSPNKSVVRLLP